MRSCGAKSWGAEIGLPCHDRVSKGARSRFNRPPARLGDASCAVGRKRAYRCAVLSAELQDVFLNKRLQNRSENLFEKSFEKGVAQNLEVRIILTRALVGVA